jgi:hypothetical protein
MIPKKFHFKINSILNNFYRKQVRDCLTDLSFSLPSKSAHAHTETSVVDGLLEQR